MKLNRWIVSFSLLLGVAIGVPSRGQDGYKSDAELAHEDEVWHEAEVAVMDYMRRSAAMVSEGYNVAYKSFVRYYHNDFLPMLDERPPVEMLMKHFSKDVLTPLLSAAVPAGTFAGMVTGVAEKWFTGVVDRRHEAGFSLIFELDAALAEHRKELLLLPDEFERDHPNDFEDAMDEYFWEEIDTPDIHRSSDYQLARYSREKLASLGFPEPSRATVESIAESILVPLVFDVKMRYQSRALEILDREDIRADARFVARKLLYPNDPDRYCEGVLLTGLMGYRECE